MKASISATILCPVALHAALKRRCLLSGRSRLSRFVGSAGRLSGLVLDGELLS
jgi:hypothetical protein